MTPYNQDFSYDIETFPNAFTCVFEHIATGIRTVFEISFRRNDAHEFVLFIQSMSIMNQRGVGFNNVGFDYPVVHYIIENYLMGITAFDIYQKAITLINAGHDEKFGMMIWDNQRHFIQLDLYLIHHFDNVNRATSLKMLEFNMRMDNISDLPFPVGTFLTSEQIDILIEYNHDDVTATTEFYMESLGDIAFRMSMDDDFLNYNDTKIGKQYFINELEIALPGSCYEYVDNRRTLRQTWRPQIALKDAIFPWIKFRTPEFERIKNWLKSQTITETKGVFKDLTCTVDGLKYVFGLGGIHGSLSKCIILDDADYAIVDLDVTSYYPSIGIANRIYPEHLSDQFCDIYENVKKKRMGFAKGTPENKALKLALNGVYGDSNSKYSPFYDPMYTMKITINGQLLLCLLSEYLANIPGLKMLQVNTDGVTFKVHRQYLNAVDIVRKTWEKQTGLELEEARYSRMFLLNVNAYIAEYETTGKLKNKKSYNYNDLTWNQNFSSLVIAKAAEAALIHGRDIREFITNHDDIMDFMRVVKVGRSDNLMEGDDEIQRTTRYYISNDPAALPLLKVSPPTKGYKVGQWKRATKLTDQYYNSVITELSESRLIAPPNELDVLGLPHDKRINTKNKSKYIIRNTKIDSGWLVTVCNDIKDARRDDINYEFYIQEAEKLVLPLEVLK